MESTQHKLNNI